MHPSTTDRDILTELLGPHGDGEAAADRPFDDETLCDYFAGRLSETEMERVRAWTASRPEAAEHLLELEPFATASPPSGKLADLEAHSAWRELQRRIGHEGATGRPRPSAARRADRWAKAIAAVFFLAACGLGLRVLELERVKKRPVANLRTLVLQGDVRSDAIVERFEIVRGEPFRVALYPAPLPPGCADYRAELREPDGERFAAIDGLRPGARGGLDLLLPGEPGARRLELTACGQPRGVFSFDLVAK